MVKDFQKMVTRTGQFTPVMHPRQIIESPLERKLDNFFFLLSQFIEKDGSLSLPKKEKMGLFIERELQSC